MVRSLFLIFLLGLGAPALAQSQPPSSTEMQVQDFMAAIPQLDEVQYEQNTNRFGVSEPVHREHMTYHHHRENVVAHRFIRDRNAREGRGQALGETALTGFTEECVAKGGYLEPMNQRPFEATLQHLFDDAYQSLWYKRLNPTDPIFDLVICSASPDRSLGVLTVTHDHLTDQTAIVLFAPSAVVTQGDLDRDVAAREAEWQRRRAQEEREAARLPEWRNNLASGSETACGPVLRTNGDLVEVVDPQTRQPRWYRRGELLPAVRLDGQSNTCR
ncbi:hypothetical protein [Aurantiacibacter aquimixticola]|uniref:Uncharacterized protein n=1 Tax=Aurantiacibacter aquimixticola TaxID=1958945 RepID=A0A419RNG9_9SPHN|nr:hypothetical protein [Aurantiacibacter aquimixticola]RJY06938.1 hypothetical protein D6201_12740 [Aurantiacibacter aquimixticola]